MCRTKIASFASLLAICSVVACQQSSVGSESSNVTEDPDDGYGSCRTTEECDPDGDYGLYCAYDVDSCEEGPGLFGTCQTMSGHCYDPEPWMVCGCDGVTYYNACYAAQHGANLRHYGQCDDGKEWINCNQDLCDGTTEFCLSIDTCGEPGRCEPLPGPLACPSVLLPVCGCDGLTYDNECKANSYGVSVSHEGECSG